MRALTPKRLGRSIVLIALAVAVCAAFPLGAGAATASKHGVTSLSPKKGKSIKRGNPPTFKVRVRGKGVVFFRVCKRKRRDKDGQICSKTDISRGKKGNRTRRGRLYSYKPIDYTFPTYWVNTPGVYYWQAYRIRCDRDFDCIQEGVIRGLRVR